MHSASAVRAFLDKWAHLFVERDVERYADLFLRDPAPIVTFSDGQRCADWLDVRLRLARDLARHHVERVEVHDVVCQDVSDDTLLASFIYDLHVRDMWGMSVVATRLATLALTETKDGYRIAAAHFSHAR